MSKAKQEYQHISIDIAALNIGKVTQFEGWKRPINKNYVINILAWFGY